MVNIKMDDPVAGATLNADRYGEGTPVLTRRLH